MTRQAQTAATDTVGNVEDEFDQKQYEEMRLIARDGFGGFPEQIHTNVRDSVVAIRAAIDANDLAELKPSAHKLNGTSATLGAKGLAALCLEIATRSKEARFDGEWPCWIDYPLTI